MSLNYVEVIGHVILSDPVSGNVKRPLTVPETVLSGMTTIRD